MEVLTFAVYAAVFLILFGIAWRLATLVLTGLVYGAFYLWEYAHA